MTDFNMSLFKRVVKLMRKGCVDGIKNKNGSDGIPSDELSFLLWKAELSKELLSFWKNMSE